jgi:phosphoribosylamine--glycine ligase
MPAEWERWPLGGKEEYPSFARKCREAGIGLVVVGPDNPLADGIVDALEAEGAPAFGPRAAAARLEWSKSFAKEVMKSAGVSTAKYVTVADADEARKFLKGTEWGAGWVLKADGLAFGKGVHVCGSLDEALTAVDRLDESRGFPLVIEERLSGEELSWMAICDGDRCALLEPARDYKRVGDGDQGPNTGGMGAFSPVPGVPASWAERVRKEIFLPVLAEMNRRSTPFRGLLYAGLMVDFARDRIWVIEFNSRFGDPETQVLMPRIEGDLLPWLMASARGDMGSFPQQVPFSREAAVGVVAAARGYPDSPEKGKRIEGVTAGEEGYFFAGVTRSGQASAAARQGTSSSGLETSGGRVLVALGTALTLEGARAAAYARLEKVRFEGMHARRDIARKEAQT